MECTKILVVDDESRMRKLVHDFLSKNNYEVLKRRTGKWRWICFLDKRTLR